MSGDTPILSFSFSPLVLPSPLSNAFSILFVHYMEEEEEEGEDNKARNSEAESINNSKHAFRW